MTSKRDDDEAGAVGRAIGEEISRAIHAERTPTPVVPSEREFQRIAREEVHAHADHCRDEGPLCVVAEKVDKLRVSSYRQNGALAFLAIIGPLLLGLWLNSRSDDRLQRQIDVAADVARQLKAVQDSARGGGAALESAVADVPSAIAQVQP
jgi:hypothetical protein